MATSNLSEYDSSNVPDAAMFKFGIVVSDWNNEITNSLLYGCIETLKKHGTTDENIIIKHVPGSFELTLGAQLMAENEDIDAIICLGCVVQGETPHFEYICQAVSHGITQINLDYNLPVIFGILTTNNIQQAKERSGGSRGNKGVEAAVAAIKMAALKIDFESL
ncbi:MAG TPA: 6,7-dimethyl-8-ribityllumazine synthase [Bacteroidales bacterium]|nr:6,7-dimethyl-8-ribityllumazine synthase [Bacteroidales bacterium]HQG53808.1 6,7-dimethyl-8-ribityllumazine synthase [Bacteroidales bacterium]HQJ21651.1 6,7-dimethyl-8-ribityllumazine synthase [Bacteroidales bacterium]